MQQQQRRRPGLGQGSFFGRILQAFCALFLMGCALVFITGLYLRAQAAETQLVDSTAEMVEQTGGTANQLLDDLSLMLYNTLMSPEVIQNAISPQLSEFENMKAVTNALSNLANSSTLIDSAYLYSNRGDLGLCSDYDLSNYQIDSYAGVLTRFGTRRAKLQPYLAHGTATYIYNEGDELYLIQGFSDIRYEKCSLYILLHLDSAAFWQTINYTADPSLLLFGPTGGQLFAAPQSGAQAESIYEQITAKNTAHGSIFVKQEQGGSECVVFAKSELSGWIYAYRTGVNQTMLSGHWSVAVLIAVLLLLLAGFALAVVATARHISTPISELVKKVSTQEGGAPGAKSEWEYLEQSYSHLITRKEELESYLPLAAESVQERVFASLLRKEELSAAAVSSQLETVHSPFLPAAPCAVVLAAVRESATDSLTEELMGLQLNAFLRKTLEPFSVHWHLSMQLAPARTLICSFEPAADETPEQQYAALRQALSQMQLENAALVWGFGTLEQSLLQLADSLAAARNALEFNRYHEQSDDAPQSELAFVGRIKGILPELQNGETALLRTKLQALLTEVRTGEPNAETRRGLYQLLLEILAERQRALQGENVQTPSLAPVPDASLDDAAAAACWQVLESLEHYLSSNQYQHVAQVKEYIAGHYADPNLSLDHTADLVGLNPAYLSRVFKTVVGQNFVTYLNECRVQNACRLLESTEMPVQEIGYLTGFSSVATFFRVFKKHTGVAPRQFRQSGRTAEEETT